MLSWGTTVKDMILFLQVGGSMIIFLQVGGRMILFLQVGGSSSRRSESGE